MLARVLRPCIIGVCLLKPGSFTFLTSLPELGLSPTCCRVTSVAITGARHCGHAAGCYLAGRNFAGEARISLGTLGLDFSTLSEEFHNPDRHHQFAIHDPPSRQAHLILMGHGPDKRAMLAAIARTEVAGQDLQDLVG
jgi:hypothetical protein